ncbi:DedA family protein [Krasilnikovia sp. MM14-A1004]|uniref:DedA family protein n=1 Tax=Krasilnikovia sp. MM14-A1004 TaxID=3373541 RepID=UPI00399C7C34
MPSDPTYAFGPAALDPQHLITTFGVLGILITVFAESGLLIGFFLPGDSLLFTTGLLIAADTYLHLPLWLACLLISIAAIVGDQVGYLIGRRFGGTLFRRPKSRLFTPQHLARSREFFRHHGARSIVLARFVPIVRTFTPIVAGASDMPYRSFVLYNVVGGVAWSCGVTLLGALLGRVAFVRSHIELILAGIVAVSLAPIAVEALRARRRTVG